MTSRVSRNDLRKARTTGSILDAAQGLFRRKGLQGTTIDEIAAVADVSVGSVYFHFRNKEGLYLRLTERALDLNEQYMRRADRPDCSPLQRVLLAGEAYLAFHLEEPGAFQMVALRVLEPTPDGPLAAVEESIAARVERLVGAVEDDLRAAVEVGEARQNVDPRDAVTFLWGAWNGVIATNLRQDRLRVDEPRLVAAIEVGRQMLLEALAAPSAKRRLRRWLTENPLRATGSEGSVQEVSRAPSGPAAARKPE